MNRSILIVICDFLLVSLLAFSTVDINKTTSEGVPRQVKVTIATNQVDNRQDLAAVMRLELEQEHKGRELLVGELAKSREAVGQQQALLGEREKQMQAFRQELQSRAIRNHPPQRGHVLRDRSRIAVHRGGHPRRLQACRVRVNADDRPARRDGHVPESPVRCRRPRRGGDTHAQPGSGGRDGIQGLGRQAEVHVETP